MLVLRALLAVSVAHALAAASQKTCHGCLYSFTSPEVPAVSFASASGDTVLNAGNPIRLASGAALSQGCNGNSLQYSTDDGATWTSSYVDAANVTRSSIDNFYASGSYLYIRTVQSYQRNLASILGGALVRLSITCNNGLSSCLPFRVSPGLASALCSDPEVCSANLSSVEPRSVSDPPTLVASAATNISVQVKLPETAPGRWNVTGNFINPETKEDTNVKLSFSQFPCFFFSSYTSGLQYLLDHAQPHVENTDDLYLIHFEIRVRWLEWFVVRNMNVTRASSSMLPVVVSWKRKVAVSSSVTVTTKSLRSSISSTATVNLEGSTPVVKLSLDTAASESYSIDPQSFRTVAQDGGALSVSDPALSGSNSVSSQRWTIKASLNSAVVCQGGDSQSITLQFALISGSKREAHEMVASLSGLSTICKLNQTETKNEVTQSGASSAKTPLAILTTAVAALLSLLSASL